MVKSGDHREMLYDLDCSIQTLTDSGGVSSGGGAAILRLTGLYHNLLREWGEL
jgi:PKHD-type hydroxylase